MHPSIQFCRSGDGCRIAFSRAGHGPPVVQTPTWLTHLDLDWSSLTWRPWLDELGRGHTIIRYDLRGCGLSDRDVDDLSIDAWVHDLEAVVDGAGLDRFPLVGLCQGGAIAAAYAARHPDRVSRLLLYGSFLTGGLRLASPSTTDEIETLRKLIETGWGRPTPAFRELFACMLMPAAAPEKTRALAEMEHECATGPMAARLWRAFHSIDISDEAPQVRCPTLVAHARDDGMVPFTFGCRLASAIPDAWFLPLEGRNHILQPEEPAWKRFWEEAHSFLDVGERRSSSPREAFPDLTAREREVLDQIARGRSNAAIAADLGIQPKTVRNHITNIFSKLGISRRAEAIVRAREAGLGTERS